MTLGALSSVAVRSLLRSRLVLGLMFAAVTAAVGFQIPTAACLNGYSKELERTAIKRDCGHAQITTEGGPGFDSVSEIAARVSALSFVVTVAPRYIQAGVIQQGEDQRPITVYAVDAVAEERFWGFCTAIGTGTCFDTLDRDQIILGERLAGDLGVHAGDQLKIVLPYDDLGEIALSSRSYRVVGILESGGGWGVDNFVFLPIQTLWHILETTDTANRMAILVDDIEQLETYVPAIQKAVANAGTAKPWWALHPFVAHSIQGNESLAWMTTILVCVGTLLPVLALMIILVIRERRHIATLGALGFSRSAIFRIYLWKTAFVGFAGTIAGGGVGIFLTWLIDRYPIYNHSGFVLRPILHAATALGPMAAVFVATLLAGIIPAVIATRQNPSSVLREE